MRTLQIIITFFCLAASGFAQIPPKNQALYRDSVSHTTYACWVQCSKYSDSSFIYFTAPKTRMPHIQVAPIITGKRCRAKDRTRLALARDGSQGPFRGRLYICWSDEKHGKNDKDVFLVYSDDNGLNWTEPILVTYRPNHKQQFDPRLYIDKKDGRVNIFYFDRQNYFEGKCWDLYLAQSVNGGLKYEYYKLNAQPLTKHSYYRVNENNGELALGLHYSPSKTPDRVLNEAALKAANDSMLVTELTIERTFMYSDLIRIPFFSNKDLTMSAYINKPLVPAYEKQVFKNIRFSKGQHSFLIETKKLGLPTDNYILTLYFNNKNHYVWILN